MPIYKRCPRCHKRIPSGSTCPCIKQRYHDYDRMSRDPKSNSFYHSSEWEKVRERAMELDGGLDVYQYMESGKIVAADTVHHIIPLRDDWDKRCEVSNLISLHHDTHSMIEQLYKKDKAGIQEKLKRMVKAYREQDAGGGAV
ncbi:MAG TPA: HNH endonuclease [Lachnospiraceae bacterium]|nr:HNH endonuclease [Lachnospiraceae bacterium]